MKSCLFCGSTVDLNTELVLTLDGGSRVKVLICNEHADQFTIADAKKKYCGRIGDAKDILLRIKQTGLKLSTNDDNEYVVSGGFRNCIYCNSSDLESDMTINVDGVKVKLAICSEHVDECSIKSARDAYKVKIRSVKSDIDKLRSYGVRISASKQLAEVMAKHGDTNEEAEKTEADSIDRKLPSFLVKKGNEIKSRKSRTKDGKIVVSSKEANKIPVQSVGGVVDGINIEKSGSYNLDDIEISEDVADGTAELEKVNIGNRDVVVPTKKQDGLGTTTINIVNRMTDAELQHRFRNMAEIPANFSQGYKIKDCPLCKGAGIVTTNNNSTQCMKCKGTGIIEY